MRHVLIAICLSVACTDEPRDPGITGLSEVESYELPQRRPPELDMLFVIDDTTAMAPYQGRIAELPALVEQVVTATAGGFPDLRIAVVANDGELRRVAAGGDPFLADTIELDFTHTTNFGGTFREALAQLVNVGAARSGANEPLAAMSLAFGGGFAREHAALGIVTITAIDDASPGAIADYVAIAKALKSDPTRVAVSGIHATPATRLDAFHAAFPNRSVTISIDEADWAPAVGLVTQLIRTTLGQPCHREPADVDPDTPGPQYDCAFSAFSDAGERVLRECVEGGAEPCWYFVAEPSCALAGLEGFDVELKVRGYPGTYHPTIRGQCLVN